MKTYLMCAVPLFSDLTAAYCLYIFLTYYMADRMMAFAFPLYIALGLAMILVNRLLVKRRSTIAALALGNAGMIAAAEVVMFLLPHDITGFLPIALAGLIFAYPAIRSFTLVLGPVTDRAILTYTELSILGTGAFLFIQVAGFAPGVWVNVVCFAALGCNIVLLAYLRSAGAAKNRIDTGARRQPVVILLVVALVILALVAVVGLLLLPASAEALIALANTVGAAILWFFGRVWQLLLYVGRWIQWLISLLPPISSVPVPEEMGVGAAAGGGEMEVVNMPAWVGLLIPLAVLALGLVIVLIVVIRNRRARIGLAAQPDGLTQQKSAVPTLWQLLLAALRRLGEKLAFYRLLLARFHTDAGVQVRLELLCARLRRPRGKGQTPREFLLALCESTPPEAVSAREGYLELADRLDRLCFGGGSGEAPLPRGLVREMMRAARAGGKARPSGRRKAAAKR